MVIMDLRIDTTQLFSNMLMGSYLCQITATTSGLPFFNFLLSNCVLHVFNLFEGFVEY